ncbi:hypothetical protein JOS77_28505 [Chromobacterium haemolyticum]|nr:hypothetical protein JOS77_28505 [Chromobacterium haemolyticum]
MQAAMDGLGVVLGPMPMAQAQIEAGVLLSPLPAPVATVRDYCWVARARGGGGCRRCRVLPLAGERGHPPRRDLNACSKPREHERDQCPEPGCRPISLTSIGATSRGSHLL